MKILECSSAGDKRFSAFYANVNIFGKIANIESHYQNSKHLNFYNPKNMKGIKPDFIIINNTKLDARFLSQWYKLLWLIYLDSNMDLVNYAKKYDFFTDKFRGRSINCQADVIYQYIKKGRESLYSDCIELINILKLNDLIAKELEL